MIGATDKAKFSEGVALSAGFKEVQPCAGIERGLKPRGKFHRGKVAGGNLMTG